MVSAYWYNPNIQPRKEHDKRLEATRKLLSDYGVVFWESREYEPDKHARAVRENQADRCRLCFQLRLEETAEKALNQGFKAFTSTLLISPHQEHDSLLSIGHEIAERTGLTFLYSDLRRRYSDSRVLTRNMQLYRQYYCGCVFSRRERGEPG